jgi:hypothetical protein
MAWAARRSAIAACSSRRSIPTAHRAAPPSSRVRSPAGEDDTPAVAATAGGFALAWIHRPPAAARAEVYFLRLTADGTPQGAPLLLRVLATADGPGTSTSPPPATGMRSPSRTASVGAISSSPHSTRPVRVGGADLLVAPREHAAAGPALAPTPDGLAVAWIGTDDALALALLSRRWDGDRGRARGARRPGRPHARPGARRRRRTPVPRIRRHPRWTGERPLPAPNHPPLIARAGFSR